MSESVFKWEELLPAGMSPRTMRNGLLGFIAAVLLYSSIFTVAAEEVGVILRFGKYVRTVNPGLSFKLPLGIEKVTKVPVERQLKLEFGFRTDLEGVTTEYKNRSYNEESLMLTGDLNAAKVEWIVQYRINDAYKFLFRVRNTVKTFRDINETTMREIVGDRTVNEVLTIGRQEIATSAAVMLQTLCDQYETGLKIEQVVLQDVNPPDEVKPAFNEVNEAQQEKEKMINQSKSEYNKVIPKALGEADQTISQAKGYALERVNQAKGEAAKFNSVYQEYSKAKEVTRQRVYLETMNDVMQKVGRKLITDEKTSGILPLFNLGKEGLKNE
ncbi:MAG: HflK protein [Candidatus Raymondbacteria bacterium RifOxyB12_full_50_8]|uniref:Protein HflK n=1 Tax=Candidatus Raymondbacteria bacterium RIFOXYD12_FULL_49_13 TaxID=1817890 RepID=A0A1F7F6C5_UNCRA|nr:MAG: HflK protein [Candidatus Raymondbacteria bacterium RIFOXYA2_FULL_49_16]OGJ96032.1 MAG: HflK protein [Candidatus Raymondbacteria bacterium RifOxyB12_full_50_8]OGK02220.1 MAG: HflK protein [Candidatus Raymondbacteria bacterium RIFOXYD12_FULL_49_13]OGP45167.1 MAG: HflK protein [Candidatus Raymondbacteria bacterium RIFOXYB2_FULL_49_35]